MINLIKANVNNSKEIHEMQRKGFKPLLEKYKDYETNPGAESLERVERRFSHPNVDQYFISLHGENIGYIRINQLDDITVRLSQICILPDFQGYGYAQLTISEAESLYPQAINWELDTIKQETKLCYLYEKSGYKLIGVEKEVQDGMILVDYAK